MTPLGRRLLVLSPHLDDAVLSCAWALMHCEHAVAATLLAGTPAGDYPLTDWDRRCGFASAADAMRARRDEDRAALGELGAQPHHLDFLDAQYAPAHGVEDLAPAIVALLRESNPDAVLMPLGLYHSDHVLVHEGARRVRSRDRTAQRRWFCYEDIPYTRKPLLLQQRLASLHADGVALTLLVHGEPGAACQVRKRRALSHYRSQLFDLGLSETDSRPLPAERYWLIEETAR